MGPRIGPPGKHDRTAGADSGCNCSRGRVLVADDVSGPITAGRDKAFVKVFGIPVRKEGSAPQY